MSKKTYDPACYDLATTFLSDSPKINTEFHRDRLATHIQSEIESWIQYEESHPPSQSTAQGGEG